MLGKLAGEVMMGEPYGGRSRAQLASSPLGDWPLGGKTWHGLMDDLPPQTTRRNPTILFTVNLINIKTNPLLTTINHELTNS